MVRRLWSPQIVKGFVGAYVVLSLVAGGVLFASQLSLGERITRVEHVQTVELCSTTVSCRHLLDLLIANIGPQERRALARRFASRRDLRRRARRLAPMLVRLHVAPTVPRPRPPGRRRVRRHEPRAHAFSTWTPAPPATPRHRHGTRRARVPVARRLPAHLEPSLPRLSIPQIPAPEPPLLSRSHGHHGPLGLPCGHLPVVERLLCH